MGRNWIFARATAVDGNSVALKCSIRVPENEILTQTALLRIQVMGPSSLKSSSKVAWHGGDVPWSETTTKQEETSQKQPKKSKTQMVFGRSPMAEVWIELVLCNKCIYPAECGNKSCPLCCDDPVHIHKSRSSITGPDWGCWAVESIINILNFFFICKSHLMCLFSLVVLFLFGRGSKVNLWDLNPNQRARLFFVLFHGKFYPAWRPTCVPSLDMWRLGFWYIRIDSAWWHRSVIHEPTPPLLTHVNPLHTISSISNMEPNRKSPVCRPQSTNEIDPTVYLKKEQIVLICPPTSLLHWNC